MKNKKEAIKQIILIILLLPIIVLFLLWVLLITPIDYIKYKRSHYYKDTKEKYTWFCTRSYWIKVYELIKKENLPIDYYRCDDAPITGYGFFVYKDTLVLNAGEPCYDAEKNIWLVEIDDEYVDIKVDVEAEIARCNDLLKNDVCKKAVILIDEDVYQEHPDVQYENIEFLPVNKEFDVEALKMIVQ